MQQRDPLVCRSLAWPAERESGQCPGYRVRSQSTIRYASRSCEPCVRRSETGTPCKATSLTLPTTCSFGYSHESRWHMDGLHVFSCSLPLESLGGLNTAVVLSLGSSLRHACRNEDEPHVAGI